MAKKGTFQKGNPGGPGRPPRVVEREYLDTTFATVPIAKWKDVVKKALEQALAGDAAARAWLSKYLLPDPTAEAGEKVGGGLQALVEALTAKDAATEPEPET